MNFRDVLSRISRGRPAGLILSSRLGATFLASLIGRLRQTAGADQIDGSLEEDATVRHQPAAPLHKVGLRLPIRAKITGPYVFLALVLALAAGFIVTRVIFDSLEERFTNQLIETGKLAGDWMVREENRLLETLRLIANTQGLAEAVAEEDADRLRTLALPVALNSQEEAIEILDMQGTALLSMRHIDGGNLEDYTFTQGEITFQQWGFVQSVLNEKVDRRGNKFAGFVRAEWGDFFYVSGPILDAKGNRIGVVLVGTPLPKIVRRIRGETLAQATLYDLRGRPISTTFSEVQSLSPEAIQQDWTSASETSFLRNMRNRNIDYVEILAPWLARGEEELGRLGVALPKSFIVRTSEITRLNIFGFASFAFVLVIITGTFVANRITRPLLGVVKASTQVAAGNLDVKVDPSSNDELAVLAQSFNQMVGSLQLSKKELLEAYDSTLEGWSKALELRDKVTEGHSQRVTEMTLRLARKMGMTDEELVYTRRGALLHDIGKMGIPDSILLKEGPLTDDDWAIMRKHPIYSHEMLWPIEYLRPALDIPYCHHEKWDGSGYPRGLEGEEIPLAARIFALVDVWDALSSHRPYRPALSVDEALRYVQEQSGKHFDPRVVEAFLETLKGDEANPQ